MISLQQPGSGRTIRVAEEHADNWRALGYTDKVKPQKRAAKRAVSKAAPKVPDEE